MFIGTKKNSKQDRILRFTVIYIDGSYENKAFFEF